MNNPTLDQVLDIRALERERAIWVDECVGKWKSSGLLTGLSWEGSSKMACLLEQSYKHHGDAPSSPYQLYLPFIIRDVFMDIVDRPWVNVVRTPCARVLSEVSPSGIKEVTVAFKELLKLDIPPTMLMDAGRTLAFLVNPLRRMIDHLTFSSRSLVYFYVPVTVHAGRKIDPSTFQPIPDADYVVSVHTRQATLPV